MLQARQLATQVRRRALAQPDTLGDGDCEALRGGVIGQPTNTVTSFAYVGAGGWLGTRVPRLRRAQRGAAAAYAGLVAITGAGSVAYHGPQFPGAQTLHDVPIGALFVLGAAVPAVRRVRGQVALPGWSGRTGATMAATGAIGAAAYVAGRTTSPCCRPRSLLQPHGLWHLATATLMAMWGTVLWVPEDADAGR
jgi:hypothetical protein